MHGERLRVVEELVVDELALVVAAQRREQPLVLVDEALALAGEHRHEEGDEGGHAGEEHEGERDRHLAAQAQVAKPPEGAAHGSPSQPRTSARGRPPSPDSTA